ncbi:obscurin-like [Triplophysa dalaica]|uniref:obscurin-like n=1 Tax=Triplophysa dalaica TaxID=1582913 RepID=UPI0024DF35DF|nr:obscurin-like [Triplophysa dalaica]
MAVFAKFAFVLISAIDSEETEVLPRATVRVTPDTFVFTGETVTLKCEIEEQYRSLDWRYLWYKDSTAVYKTHPYTVNTNTLTISSVTQSDQSQFWCKTEIHGRPQTSSRSSVYLTVKVLPRVTVRVTPDTSVFTGETVTLKCEIEQYRSLDWRYLWYKDRTEVYNSHPYTVNTNTLTISSVTQSDQSQYWCRGEIRGRPQTSQRSSTVHLIVIGSKPKAELTSDTEGSVLTGNTVTLTCLMNQFTGWKFNWYQHTQNTEKTTTDTNTYTMSNVRVSDGGQYWCRAGRGYPVYYTDYSDVLWINVTESPKAVLSVEPDKQLFSGETVTLRCDIQTKQDTEWTYSWTVEKNNQQYTVNRCKTQECKIRVYHSDSGHYTCRGNGQNSEKSEAVTLTVSSYKPKTLLRVSQQQWLTEGDSVTLMCEVNRSSTGWTFSWFTELNLSSGYDLVSDSSGGSKGNYTVSSAALKHTGVYMCGAERGDPVYHTHNSSTQPLWITGVSSSVSLIIRPNRTQHFSSESLSLSCEDHRNSTGWTVRRYTNTLETCSSSSVRSTGTESTCTIRSLITSDTGVYWCESESGHKLHPVNISIHNADVILDSPVHPVTEGDSLTLHCLYQDKIPSNLRAEFYKDGSVVQNQTTGDMMIISTVSKSHEGFYYCKHPERGESPKSWISVAGFQDEMSGLKILSFLLAVCPYLIVTVVLVFKCYRLRDETSDSSDHMKKCCFWM